MLKTRRPLGATTEQALGWVVRGKGDGTLIAHNGGSLGYASAMARDPQERIGVTVLMNQVGDVSDIAYHLLQPSVPLAKPTVVAQSKEIVLDTAMLELYAGRYEAKDEGVFVIVH